MNVHKETWVDVGNGSPQEISAAMYKCEVPEKASATEINRDFYAFMIDNLVSDQGSYSYVSIKFEWDDEE